MRSRFTGDTPEIDRGVRPPGPPSFSALFEFLGIRAPQSAQKANITPRKRIGFAESAHRHVLSCPFSNPENRTQASQKGIGIHYALKTDFTLTDRSSETPNAERSCFRQANAGEIGVGKNFWCGKKMSEAVATGERLSKGSYQPYCKRSRPFDRDLLAENGANRELEAIPRTGQSQPWIRPDQVSQDRIRSESSSNCGPVGIQVKHLADSLNDCEERARITKLNSCNQGGIGVVKRDLKVAVIAIQRNRATITDAIDQLHARSCTRGEKCQHALPVVRRTKTETEKVLVLWLKIL